MSNNTYKAMMDARQNAVQNQVNIARDREREIIENPTFKASVGPEMPTKGAMSVAQLKQMLGNKKNGGKRRRTARHKKRRRTRVSKRRR